mgnify:CR=1 FL=1
MNRPRGRPALGKGLTREDILAAALTLLDDDTIIADAPRKVSGKGDKPIIDITGAQVRETFGHNTHVLASFAAGVIRITPC